MKTPTELTQLFGEGGLKVTPQRQRSYRIVHGNGSHPTAHSVLVSAGEEMPTISLRTVYHILHDPVALGEEMPTISLRTVYRVLHGLVAPSEVQRRCHLPGSVRHVFTSNEPSEEIRER